MVEISSTKAAAAYKNTLQAAEKLAQRIVDENPAQGQSYDGAQKINFSDLVAHSLQSARDSGYKSEELSAKSMAGQAELHELVTTVANAELTLNTVVAVRDRVINAYQDIIKMPI